MIDGEHIRQSLHNMTVMSMSQIPLLRQQLHQLKLQQQHLAHLIQVQSQHTVQIATQAVQRMAERVMDEIRERKRCEVEVEKSKAIQNSMKNEVMQLKEMINAAMIDYSQDLNQKQQEIKRLNGILSINSRKNEEQTQQSEQEEMRIEESRQSESKAEELEIIQEVSEHCTYSSAAATLRQLSRQEKNIESEEDYQLQLSEAEKARNALSQISQVIEAESQMVSKDDKPEPFLGRTLQETAAKRVKTEYREDPYSQMTFDGDKQNFEVKDGHRRTKSFIDHFRKTIEQSLMDKNQQAVPINPVCFSKKGQPLQELSQNQVHLPAQCHSQSFKPQAQKESCHPKTVYMNSESSSKASSIVNEINLNDTDTVFVPRKIETPKNMMFKKKESSKRIMTEPSQESKNYPYYTFQKQDPSRKTPASHSKHSLSRKNLIRQRGGSQDERRSVRRSTSKQKIKVTVKMFEESQPKKSSKGLVHLGGKGVFRKFLLELKTAFRQFNIKLGGQADEVKYEGQSRNGQRWGRGRLYYRDGCVYQGQFRQNLRHGKGSIFLNGISIYQGNWHYGQVHGEGYIKSMRFLSDNCPSTFSQASYCGNLASNKLHGIGTIFLNPRQKIVTKFANGVPTGELTYYNLRDIEFGVWPCE